MAEQIPLIDLEPEPVPEKPTVPIHVYLVVAWQAVEQHPPTTTRVVYMKREVGQFVDNYDAAVEFARNLSSQWTHREIVHVVLGGQVMARAKFALGANPEHPGQETILADRGDGWRPVRRGKFTPAENEAQIERLRRQGIEVKVLRRAS